jgi:lipoprotein-anchoring transpeptidase ErfK/SrfK
MWRLALALTILAAVAAGCGGKGGEDTAAPKPEAPPSGASKPKPTSPAQPASPAPSATPARCALGTSRSYASRGVAAVATSPTVAFREPGRGLIARFGLRNVNGVQTTFRVLEARLAPDCRPSWYRVQLPIRPNGTEGWIRAKTVRRYTVEFRILVDLSDRIVTVYRGDEVLVRTPTAIGRPETPTPTGNYYVNQRLLAADPSGAFGPGGIGISAFSPTLAHWAQGGPIGIHGTNQPSSIGQVISNGCLRIDNAVLERLIHLLPDGTPVRIRV